MMTANETMQAARVHRFGGPDVIAVERVAIPKPGAGEVLVKVGAAGVGPWDAWIRAGRSVLPQPLPLTLGSDFAGTVAAVGTGVDGFVVGDAVFGVTNGRFTGAYAAFAVAEAGRLAKKPQRLDDAAAASAPVVAVTAWQALFDHARLEAGQTILIHGAAGAVGRFAVQLAHRAGLRVVATASSGDLAELRRLGADVAIDHRGQRFEEVVSGVDAVLDMVGGETQARSFAVLARGGTLVSIVSDPDQAAARRHGVRALFFLVDVTAAALREIARGLETGALETNVGLVLPLAEARLAHEMLDGIRAKPRGKIILQPSLNP